MTDRAAFEGIQSATILKPGDKVLLTVGRGWDRYQMHLAQHEMSQRFPEVEFLFVCGVEDVVVKPSEGSTDRG